MPLDTAVDTYETLLALGCGAVSATLHFAAVLTSGRVVPPRRLVGQMMGSFASGLVVTWIASLQPLFKVDLIGAASLSAVVGFAYGPTGLIIAAQYAEKKYGYGGATAKAEMGPEPDAAELPADQAPRPVAEPPGPPTDSDPERTSTTTEETP